MAPVHDRRRDHEESGRKANPRQFGPEAGRRGAFQTYYRIQPATDPNPGLLARIGKASR